VEHIRDALIKANVALDQHIDGHSPDLAASHSKARAKPVAPEIEGTPRWTPRRVELDARRLEANRIVAVSMDDPNHVAFNLLRTRVHKSLKDNSWKIVGVTSPTPGCGKTMVALNLAFSLARMSGFRTVLLDLDLKKPSIARMLGLTPKASIGQFLEGVVPAEDCFVQPSSNLAVGLNIDRLRHSSELMQSPRLNELLKFVEVALSPNVVLVDLPPMRSSDDALGVLPLLDAALLVLGAGMSTVADADECERQISDLGKLLGIVMNRSNEVTKEYYY
jgi:Mrp family chromosome partitioning ATPase